MLSLAEQKYSNDLNNLNILQVVTLNAKYFWILLKSLWEEGNITVSQNTVRKDMFTRAVFVDDTTHDS